MFRRRVSLSFTRVRLSFARVVFSVSYGRVSFSEGRVSFFLGFRLVLLWFFLVLPGSSFVVLRVVFGFPRVVFCFPRVVSGSRGVGVGESGSRSESRGVGGESGSRRVGESSGSRRGVGESSGTTIPRRDRDWRDLRRWQQRGRHHLFADGQNSESKKFCAPLRSECSRDHWRANGAHQRQRRGTPGALKLEEAEQQQ